MEAPVRQLSAWGYGGFPKIRGPFLGVLIIRTLVFWGLYWGPLILRNYHIDCWLHLSNLLFLWLSCSPSQLCLKPAKGQAGPQKQAMGLNDFQDCPIWTSYGYILELTPKPCSTMLLSLLASTTRMLDSRHRHALQDDLRHPPLSRRGAIEH